MRAASRRGHARIAVAIIVAALTALAGCGNPLAAGPGEVEGIRSDRPTTTGPPQRGGRLVYAIESDPNGLDPTTNAWDNSAIQLANALFDPLTAYDAEGTPRPYLAEAMEPDDGYRRWTIRLRPGVEFSNGTPLDADALVTFLDALRASSITGPATQMMSDVRALDDRTVEIRTSAPWATLPALLTGQGGYVVAPAQINNAEGHSDPIGTGPFVLRSWKVDERFELARNENYWRAGLPLLDAVDFVVEPHGRDRVASVLNGHADVTNVSAPADLRHLNGLLDEPATGARLQVESDEGDAEKTFVMFNTRRPPLDDPRVRRAIAYATDTRAIGEHMGWGPELQAQGPFSPTSPYFSPAEYPTYDPDKARALIREYLADTRIRNRRREISFTLSAGDNAAETVELIKRQWADVGIRVTVSLADIKQVVRLAVIGEYDAMFLRYFASPDPDALWHFFVADTLTDSGISLNFARLRNEAITEGMTAGRATLDPDARRAAYADVQQAFAEQMPYVWLNRAEWRIVANTRVRGAHNVTLPGGEAALPLLAGTHRLTETWLSR